MKQSLVSIAIALAVAAGSAHAELLRARHNLAVDRTHVNAAGGIATRHLQQNVNANGFNRNLVKTNPQGQTATRTTDVVNDAAAGTHTRTVDGTTFAGKTYAGESVTAKTATGFTREGTFTGVNGNTGTRSADVSIDRDSGTLTKNVSTSGPNGNASTTTVVRELP